VAAAPVATDVAATVLATVGCVISKLSVSRQSRIPTGVSPPFSPSALEPLNRIESNFTAYAPAQAPFIPSLQAE